MAFLNSVEIRAPGDTHLRFYNFVQIECVHIKYCAFKQKQTINALTKVVYACASRCNGLI